MANMRIAVLFSMREGASERAAPPACGRRHSWHACSSPIVQAVKKERN
jgi:hypothetical protein